MIFYLYFRRSLLSGVRDGQVLRYSGGVSLLLNVAILYADALNMILF